MVYSIYLCLRLDSILKLGSFGAAKVTPVLTDEERYSSPEKSPRDGIEAGQGGRAGSPSLWETGHQQRLTAACGSVIQQHLVHGIPK